MDDRTRKALRDYLDARLDQTVSDETAIEYADALAATLTGGN
jgi:hypothetical protein